MPLDPARVADPTWRAWLSSVPLPLQSDWDEALHDSVMTWLRQTPSATDLARHEADELVTDFLLYSRRIKRAQRRGVNVAGMVFTGAIVGLIGYAVDGLFGALAAPLFNFALATYAGKLHGDHRRRQAMIDEMDTMIDNLIDRVRR